MSKEAIKYITATLAAFGPDEAISMTKETWSKLREAIKTLAEQPAQQEPVAWIDPKHLEWLAQSPDNLTGAGLAARQRSADMVPLYTSPPAQRKPLTDEQIQEVVTKAVRERKLSWLGFKKDDQGEYTIPVLSSSDYQMARAIEAANGIKEQP